MEVPNIVNRDCAEEFLQYLENMSYQTDTPGDFMESTTLNSSMTKTD